MTHVHPHRARSTRRVLLPGVLLALVLFAFPSGSPMRAATTCNVPPYRSAHVPIHDKATNHDYWATFSIATNHEQRPDGCYWQFSFQVVTMDKVTGAMGPTYAQHLHAHLRIWVCGQRRADLDQDWDGSPAVSAPDMPPINYGSCGPQVDDDGSGADNSNWIPSHVFAHASIPSQ
jgi:hypothetical protein